MNRQASFQFKLFYCMAVLGAVVPVGLASSGWVLASMGGGPFGFVPFVGPILLLALGLYRVLVVARVQARWTLQQ